MKELHRSSTFKSLPGISGPLTFCTFPVMKFTNFETSVRTSYYIDCQYLLYNNMEDGGGGFDSWDENHAKDDHHLLETREKRVLRQINGVNRWRLWKESISQQRTIGRSDPRRRLKHSFRRESEANLSWYRHVLRVTPRITYQSSSQINSRLDASLGVDNGPGWRTDRGQRQVGMLCQRIRQLGR